GVTGPDVAVQRWRRRILLGSRAIVGRNVALEERLVGLDADRGGGVRDRLCPSEVGARRGVGGVVGTRDQSAGTRASKPLVFLGRVALRARGELRGLLRRRP